jgi:hypothetical protein
MEKKLRTLKDLGGWERILKEDLPNEHIFKGELRQEAIKWIKSGKMVEGAKFWAIKFFNLTNKDLEWKD